MDEMMSKTERLEAYCQSREQTPQGEDASCMLLAHELRYLLTRCEEARDALSRLSSWVSNGLGEDTTTAADYEARIRDGIDRLIRFETTRLQEEVSDLRRSWVDKIERNAYVDQIAARLWGGFDAHEKALEIVDLFEVFFGHRAATGQVMSAIHESGWDLDGKEPAWDYVARLRRERDEAHRVVPSEPWPCVWPEHVSFNTWHHGDGFDVRLEDINMRTHDLWTVTVYSWHSAGQHPLGAWSGSREECERWCSTEGRRLVERNQQCSGA